MFKREGAYMLHNEVKIIENLKEELGLKKDKELCELFGIKQNTLSTWKKRNTLDYKKIIQLCFEKKIDLETIFYRKKPVQVPINKASFFGEIVKLRKIRLKGSNRNITVFKSFVNGSEHDRVVLTQRLVWNKMKSGSEYILIIKKPEPQIYKCYFTDYNKDGTIEVILNTGEKFNFRRTDVESVWTILDEILMN